MYHTFWPESDEAVIGEVSTANDDAHDNFFVDPNIGRFPAIDEDEHPLLKLLWDNFSHEKNEKNRNKNYNGIALYNSHKLRATPCGGTRPTSRET